MADMTDAEILAFRQLYEGVGVVTVSGVDGKAQVTADGDLCDAMLTSFRACPRLIAEVQRHRSNMAAIESSLTRFPASMTPDRMLAVVKAARHGALIKEPT